MVLMVSLSSRISPRTGTVILRERSPLARPAVAEFHNVHPAGRRSAILRHCRTCQSGWVKVAECAGMEVRHRSSWRPDRWDAHPSRSRRDRAAAGGRLQSSRRDHDAMAGHRRRSIGIVTKRRGVDDGGVGIARLRRRSGSWHPPCGGMERQSLNSPRRRRFRLLLFPASWERACRPEVLWNCPCFRFNSGLGN